ncbi:MAG: Flp family type IVb pilin [Alphaproteobacteria bacterium]
MFELMRRFKEDDGGATAIEYGLIAALASLAIVGGTTSLGVSLNSIFDGISLKIDVARCVEVGSNCSQ